jgi:hypothetical protein
LLLSLAFGLPFETIRPLFATGGVGFTNTEILAVAALAAAGVVAVIHLATSGTRRTVLAAAWQTPLLAPAAALLAARLISAAAAPAYRDDALKAALHVATGAAVFLATAWQARSARRQEALLWALTGGAAVSALVGLGEVLGLTGLPELLTAFRVAPTTVAGVLRLSGTLQYATIAAMVYELAVPLAVGLAAAGPAGGRAGRWLALALATIGSAAVALTLTRAALAALAGVLILLVILAAGRPRFRRLAPGALASLSALLGVTAIIWLGSDVARARLATADSASWYGASYMVAALPPLRSGEQSVVPVTVRNRGTLPWGSGGEHPFVLRAIWLTAAGDGRYELGPQWAALPNDVAAGEEVVIDVPLAVPLPAGQYRLALGMVHADVIEFALVGVPDQEVAVTVAPGRVPAPPLPGTTPWPDPDEVVLPTLSRPALWRAAVRMWLERPLLGHGANNFRLLHGRYLGLDEWDTRVNANNLYLETAAGTGLLGLAALFWLIAAAGRLLVRLYRVPTAGPAALWAAGLAAALLAFLAHGLLDTFLEFTPVYLALAVILGLVVAIAGRGEAPAVTRDPQPPTIEA